MRNLIQLTLLSGVALSSSLLAQSGEDRVLGNAVQPSGPWQLNSGTDSCDLQRDYQTDKGVISLLLSRASGPGILDVALIGSGIPKLPERSNVNVRLDPQGVSQSFQFSSMQAPGRRARFMRGYDISSSLFTNLSANQQISFAYDKGFTLTLSLPGAKAAFAAMQKCYEDLLRGWNVDPMNMSQSPSSPDALREGGNPGVVIAQPADQPRQPIPKGSWVSFLDYPSAALQEGGEGTVVMALSINALGRVDTCRVVVSSKVQALDQRSCEVMIERAHYPLAPSISGATQASTAIERIRWVIPQVTGKIVRIPVSM